MLHFTCVILCWPGRSGRLSGPVDSVLDNKSPPGYPGLPGQLAMGDLSAPAPAPTSATVLNSVFFFGFVHSEDSSQTHMQTGLPQFRTLSTLRLVTPLRV